MFFPQDTSNELGNLGQHSSGWDCSLHLPLFVSDTEKRMIEKRLDDWNKELEASGADITNIALALRKPLRPLWISQKTVIWLNEVPDYDSWDFTPVILVSASSTNCTSQQRTTSEFSWNYIAGAGDDEESWARGLSPDLFWKNAYDIISSDPDFCNQMIANIVEKDRVRRAYRGENAPQVSVRHTKCLGSVSSSQMGETVALDNGSLADGEKTKKDDRISFLGSTNIAVCKSQLGISTSLSSVRDNIIFGSYRLTFSSSGPLLSLSIIFGPESTLLLPHLVPPLVNRPLTDGIKYLGVLNVII